MNAGRIFRNFAALTLAQGFTMITGLVTVIVLARALGPEAYGVLGFGAAVLSYFGLATNFGMDAHGVREISRDETKTGAVVGIVLTSRTCLAIVFFALLYLIATNVEMPVRTRSVLIIQGAGLFFVALNLEFAYQGLQRMTTMAVRQMTAGAFVVAATLLLISNEDDLYIAAAIPIAANLLTAGALLIHFKTTGFRIKIANQLSRYVEFLRRAAPVAIMGTLNTIYVNLDIIILGVMRSEQEVGLYAAASRVFIMMLVISSVLHNAFLPAMSEVAENEAEKHHTANNYARIICFVGGGVGVAGAIFSQPILHILFGEAFIAANLALAVLLLNAGLAYFTLAYGTPLLAWQSDRAYVKILMIGALVNLGLNLLLIPRFGIEGAAIATLITQAVVLAFLAFIVNAAHQVSHVKLIIKIVFVAIACGIPLAAYDHLYGFVDPVAFVIGGFGFGVVYTGLSAKLKLIDLQHFRSIFAQQKKP